MSYTAPALTTPVVLTGSYTAPALIIQVVLGEAVTVVTGTLSATLPAATPALTLTGRAELVYTLTCTADLGLPALPLTLSATAEMDIALPDSSGPRLRQDSAQSQVTATGRTLAQQPMLATLTAAGLNQTTADLIRVGSAWRHAHGLPVRRSLTERAAHGIAIQRQTGLPSAEALRQRRAVTERAAHGLPIRIGAGLPDAETIRTQTRRALTEQQAMPLALRLTVGQHQATVSVNRLRLHWATGEDPKPGRWWPFYEVPPLTAPVVLQHPYSPRPLRCVVALSWTWVNQPYCVDVDPITVPIQEVYLVINSFSLVRADTGQAVDALDFSASLDADSWGWSWSASIPASQMSRVRSPSMGEFVELIATVNGTALRLVVESLARSRSFGNASLKISGRGRAAWLADPHSPIQTVINTETRTAQQLLNDALTVNGVPIGWAVDWQVEDWIVSAGLFSHTGTYISAATRIAEAAGGYVQADDALQTLHILPHYPLAPWAWAAAMPDLILPEAVCTTEGIEWQDKPAYNAIWVVGAEHGRRDQVKRTGTAGDRSAPTVMDPLATSTIMTRQRGLRALADTGRQAHLSLSLPILAETGIIKPGLLIEYTEQGVTHRGLSRSVSVTCQFPTARQTIKVETHELESV